MGRKKLPYDRVRVRLEGFLRADDPLLKQIQDLPAGSRFPTVIRWLKAGQALQSIQEDTDERELREQVQAAKEILDAFVVE